MHSAWLTTIDLRGDNVRNEVWAERLPVYLRALQAVYDASDTEHIRSLMPSVKSVLLGTTRTAYNTEAANTLIFSYLPKTLRSVSFSLHELKDCMQTAIKILGYTAVTFSNLENLDIWYNGSRKVPPNLVRAVSASLAKALRLLSRLQKVKISPLLLSEDVLYGLGALADLREIAIYDSPNDNVWSHIEEKQVMDLWNALVQRSDNCDEKLFGALSSFQGLYVSVHPVVEHKYFSLFSPSLLTSLSLRISVCFVPDGACIAEDHKALYESLSWLTGLRSISLVHYLDTKKFSKTYQLACLPCKQFERLKSLEELEISHTASFGFDEQHLLHASQSWSHLKYLRLQDWGTGLRKQKMMLSFPSTGQPQNVTGFSADVIRPLLSNMPRLEMLEINLKPPNKTTSDASVLPTKLNKLHLGNFARYGPWGNEEVDYRFLMDYLRTFLPGCTIETERKELPDVQSLKLAT
jgi:hypothetical protein